MDRPASDTPAAAPTAEREALIELVGQFRQAQEGALYPFTPSGSMLAAVESAERALSAPVAAPSAEHDAWMAEAKRLLRAVRVTVTTQCMSPCAKNVQACDAADAALIAHLSASAPVAAQPAASGVDALWKDALQELAHRIKRDGLDIFDGPETPQMVRDAIEWFAAELSVSDLSTALTGAAKE